MSHQSATPPSFALSGHPESPMARSAYARTQREMWRDVLAWKNLKESLLLNELRERDRGRADRRTIASLSAYAHPFTEDMTDRLYGRNPRGGWPTEDHYAEELCPPLRAPSRSTSCAT